MSRSLADRLIALRRRCAGERGQRRFARMVGIKQQSISNYERGSQPSADVLAKIVRASGCRADWLLLGRGNMFPEGTPTTTETNGHAARWRDANGARLDLEAVADLLGLPATQAHRLAERLQDTTMPFPYPLVAVPPNGRAVLLVPEPPPAATLDALVRVEVSDTEIAVHVPAVWLASRSVRIEPRRE